MSTPERAGWYDDPEDETQLRYFDGIIWSERTVPRQSARAQSTPQQGATHPDPGPSGRPGTDVFGRPAGGSGPASHQPGKQYPPRTAAQAPSGWGTPPDAEPMTRDGQPLASYGSRVGAYIIDGFILMVINLIVVGWAWWLWIADYWSFVWDAALAEEPSRVEGLTPDQVMGMLEWRYLFIAVGLSLLVQALYHVGFLAARNATPGKMVLGLSVRRVDHPGPLGVGTAFMRMLLPLGIGVFSMVPLLGYLLWLVRAADLLWPIKDSRRQALHDKIAGTQVVRGKQPRRHETMGA